MDAYHNIEKLGVKIPEAPTPGGLYEPTVLFANNMLYVSGITPRVGGVMLNPGKVGIDICPEQAKESARQCVLNMLGVLQRELKDLNRIKKVVKILGFVACGGDFYDQPKVMDAASQLFIDVFGVDAGKASRSAVGAVSLPGNAPVEIEALFELKNN
jgi:enamine deaminase RidA (YjgF/YER057c/UK114 family)